MAWWPRIVHTWVRWSLPWCIAWMSTTPRCSRIGRPSRSSSIASSGVIREAASINWSPLRVACCLSTATLAAVSRSLSSGLVPARRRNLALFERYGALLTEHQQEVLDLSLRSDWSLAEIADHEGTSRAAVHDIVRRSTEAGRRRRKVASLERELVNLKQRVAALEG